MLPENAGAEGEVMEEKGREERGGEERDEGGKEVGDEGRRKEQIRQREEDMEQW